MIINSQLEHIIKEQLIINNLGVNLNKNKWGKENFKNNKGHKIFYALDNDDNIIKMSILPKLTHKFNNIQ